MSLTAMFLGLNSSLVSKCFMCHPNESLLSAIYYIYLKVSCINSFIKHVLFIKHRHYFKVARNISSRSWKWVEDKRVTQNWDVRLKVSRGNDKYTWVLWCLFICEEDERGDAAQRWLHFGLPSQCLEHLEWPFDRLPLTVTRLLCLCSTREADCSYPAGHWEATSPRASDWEVSPGETAIALGRTCRRHTASYRNIMTWFENNKFFFHIYLFLLLLCVCFVWVVSCVSPPEHPLRDPRETSHQLHEQRVHRDRRDHRSQSHDNETRLSEIGDPQLKILGNRGNSGWMIITFAFCGRLCFDRCVFIYLFVCVLFA